ncbi:MAG: LysM peptidoglycan-binding domain-containing protein, partial [Thermodesulfobacteriota bacterium]|nr:LysM peptidoglycan-binding domain-containing protein [Thermodesulfobacteriota bacterium]
MVRRTAVVLVFLLMASGSRGDEADRPKIFLEKKIFAESSEGQKSFYEVHTVEKGESLWKILREKAPLFPQDYPALLRAFRRANPEVKDPGRLRPGEEILVPASVGMKTARLVQTGRSVVYQIRKGDTLSGILTSRGVVRQDISRYLAAVVEINESVRDVNLIRVGKAILIPTEKYFAEAVEVAEAPPAPPGPLAAAPAPVAPETPPVPPGPLAAAPAPVAPETPPAPPGPLAAVPAPVAPETPPVTGTSEVALTRDEPQEPGSEAIQPAIPESQVAVPSPPPAESGAVMTGGKDGEPALPPLPRPKSPYRGLLSDLVGGLGEKWVDRGTLYLPIPSGGEVVLNLEEYPVVRFSGGIHALIDFRGALPEEVRQVITETWKNYRVVPMDGTQGALDMIGRLLDASGYYSVKEGFAHPPVIGEDLSVTLPARWVILRTSQSLLNGEIILIKEVPEKPGHDLSMVLRYAEQVGIRVLPFAYDPSAYEGFLVGLDPVQEAGEVPPLDSLPPSGLQALDFTLELLGIPSQDGKRIRIGGKKESFLLTVQPEKIFEA